MRALSCLLMLAAADALRLPAASRSHVRMCTGEESTYAATSSPTKRLVAGLTGVVNSAFALLGGDAEEAVRPPRSGEVTPPELLEGVRADYEERMYLWTGDIDENLYDEDCTFTDPTLSFEGLATFQRNLAALQPILTTVVKSPLVELYGCELDESCNEVRASWRMKGDLALPWQPTIDLKGSTKFVYDPISAGGRITQYIESWDIEAGAALMQILTPAAWSSSGSDGEPAEAPWFLRAVPLPPADEAETKAQALRRILASSFGAQVGALTLIFVGFLAWSSTALDDEFWMTPF